MFGLGRTHIIRSNDVVPVFDLLAPLGFLGEIASKFNAFGFLFE